VLERRDENELAASQSREKSEGSREACSSAERSTSRRVSAWHALVTGVMKQLDHWRTSDETDHGPVHVPVETKPREHGWSTPLGDNDARPHRARKEREGEVDGQRNRQRNRTAHLWRGGSDAGEDSGGVVLAVLVAVVATVEFMSSSARARCFAAEWAVPMLCTFGPENFMIKSVGLARRSGCVQVCHGMNSGLGWQWPLGSAVDAVAAVSGWL
jgi:hypothetical protein